MVHSGLQIMALIPTRLYDNKISMPQVRRSLVVSKRRHRFNSKVPLWFESIPVSRAGRRNYHRVLRRAGTRGNPPIEGNENLQVSACSTQHIPANNKDWRDSGSSWIKGKRNSISSRNINGPRATRARKCAKRASRRVDLAIDSDSQKTFRN